MNKLSNTAIANNSTLVNQHLERARQRDLPQQKFRESIQIVGKHALQTALSNTTESPIFIPVLRAGIAGLDPILQKSIPSQTHFVGMHRNKQDPNLPPTIYYDDIPQCTNTNQPVFLIDPMLATGNSLLYVINRVKDLGYTNINIVAILAAPEGIHKINQNTTPELNIKITIAHLDQCLDAKDYIVPGLGDAGDRYFGETNWLDQFSTDLNQISSPQQHTNILNQIKKAHLSN